jgi:dienelactone hydrolase
VEATSQAGSYQAKPDLVIACPTNRRPYGFDWEDWGRADALEVMRLAAAEWMTDPRRQYLTGHSMGGHGTWQLGVHYPERFAAVAPSAGWLSFATYGGSGRQGIGPEGTSAEAALAAAAACSDTPAMLGRLKGVGIYILHGDADDNVPVEQARTARRLLGDLGIECGYHEQEGAGHWWGDASSGAACMDWPAIFEMFASRTLAAPADPGASLATALLDDHSMPRGSFKRAFARRFALVYGTKGTPQENAWSLAKARYDAEQWWYRGNGSARLLADTDAAGRLGEGNFILYGNAETNAAWSLVMPGEPLLVDRGHVRVGDKEWTGDDLGVLAVAHDATGRGLIGVVAGTGLHGARSLDRMPYFLSGTGFPERLVVRSRVWTEGVAGIEHAGTAGPDSAGK